VIKDSLNLT